MIHSIVVCLAALALPLMVACSSQGESLPENVAETVLFLNIEPIGQTRAGTADLPGNEKMHSVRVIILHEGGTVEHNKLYSLDGAQEQRFVLLKVTPNEKKKIFLFANEESVSAVEGVTAVAGENQTQTLTAFFDSYGEGAPDFESAVNGLYFTPDYSDNKPIPMSSMYEIDIPEKEVVKKTFYVVRVATKFTVNFKNWRGEEVIVDKFTIASHADKNFLMARVGNYPPSNKYPTWIDWLKDVSDDSNKDSDAATKQFGWLMDYELPESADKAITYTHGPVRVTAATMDADNPAPGVAETIPVFYLPESKNLKAGATDGEQEYILTLRINGRDEPFVCKLSELKALFRNTHVVVNITMYHNLEFEVEVIPFSSVDLEPDYGLEREEFTGYIVGKDKEGRPCWYEGNYYDPASAVPLYLGPADNPEQFVTINGKEYLLVYSDYERKAATLDHFFEKETRKKYLLDAAGRTGYSFSLNPAHPEWGADIYYNKLQQRVWLSEDYNEWIVGEKENVEIWFWQAGTTWYRTLNEWDRLNWNQAIYWNWTHVYPKYWFDVLGNRYPWSEGDTNEKRKAKLIEKIGEDWIQYLE